MKWHDFQKKKPEKNKLILIINFFDHLRLGMLTYRERDEKDYYVITDMYWDVSHIEKLNCIKYWAYFDLKNLPTKYLTDDPRKVLSLLIEPD